MVRTIKYMCNSTCSVCCSLSPLGRDLLPGLLEAVDGSALQPGQDCLQGVVVAKLVALTGNLQRPCVCVIEKLSWSRLLS